MGLTAAEERLAQHRPALEAWLADAAGASRVSLAEAKALKGGAIQENWLVALEIAGGPHAGRQELVLRTDSPSGVEASLSRAQEFRLLKAAKAVGVTVPSPLWLCEDLTVLGRPFYLMRRLAGTAAGVRIMKEAKKRTSTYPLSGVGRRLGIPWRLLSVSLQLEPVLFCIPGSDSEERK